VIYLYLPSTFLFDIINPIIKKILFICSANKDRSRTAEDHFQEVFPEQVFESAGTNQVICDQEGTTYMSKELLDAATHIFVMETKHQQAITKKFGNAFFQKISVLHIKDHFQYGSKELIHILEQKVQL